MPKITLTIGAPGSGKTTWAKEQDGHRLNRDDIRFALFGKYTGLSEEQEKQVGKLQFESAEILIQQGKDVIIDDTNLNRHTRQAWHFFCKEHKVPLIHKVFEVSNEECYRRTEERWKREGERRIPRDVIIKMNKRLGYYMSERKVK